MTEVEKKIIKTTGFLKNYGLKKTRNGVPQVFVSFDTDNDRLKWYEFPLKKDGTPKLYVVEQLKYMGFDFNKSLLSLGEGPSSGVLPVGACFDIYLKEVVSDDLEKVYLKLVSIGIPPREGSNNDDINANELANMFTEEQLNSFKAFAAKG